MGTIPFLFPLLFIWEYDLAFIWLSTLVVLSLLIAIRVGARWVLSSSFRKSDLLPSIPRAYIFKAVFISTRPLTSCALRMRGALNTTMHEYIGLS